jgi:trehalose 6-phosphate phosphatase
MAQTKARPSHLLKSWKQVSKRIRAAESVWLFLDFDGTLVPFCPTPEGVKLPEAVRRILHQLNRHPRVRVALVSGRRNAELRRHVRVPRLHLMGLYGWENNGEKVLPAKTLKALPHLRSILNSLPEKFPGIWVEEKGVSFAIHFRGASPAAIRGAKDWAQQLVDYMKPDFRAILSHSTCEIAPRQIGGKGVALTEFTKKISGAFLPIYLGDDLTDEPAFKALRSGITVRVGPNAPTSAQFRLSNPAEVHRFLEQLIEEMS